MFSASSLGLPGSVKSLLQMRQAPIEEEPEEIEVVPRQQVATRESYRGSMQPWNEERTNVEINFYAGEQQLREQARRDVMQEFREMREILQATEAPPQPIIIQNNAASKAEAHIPEYALQRPPRDPGFVILLRQIFGSRVNRIFFFASCGIGLYMLHDYMQHTWRTIEMQKKIDSNFVLRMSQWMSKSL